MEDDCKPLPQGCTKHSTCDSTEHEVFQSDRVDLMKEANRFVESMVSKVVLPMIESSFAAQVELSSEEDATYKSALQFLRREFEAGERGPVAIECSSEHERTIEVELPSPHG